VSLYRTWRPKSFGDLVGQDAVVRTLQTALSSGKLAHAYLFSGPRGSGKTSAAKIMARCVNCVKGPTAEPDNTCEACLAILAGTALDVLEIDAASNRGIDAIRELREAVRFAPAQMPKKVYILDEAHAITSEGANAFLKTLEEPPPHVIFILATTEPDKLPPTVLSRCQRYAFRRIPVETMIDRMRVIADAEGIGIADDALAAIAYRADGGLRDALTMLEQVAAFAGAGVGSAVVIGPAEIDAAFGSSGRTYARALVAAVNAGEAATSLRIIDEASEAGTDMGLLLQSTLEGYRNLLVARLNPALLGRDLSAPDAEAAALAAAATPETQILRGLRVLSDAHAAARRTGARLELETAVLRLVMSADPSLEGLGERVAALERTLAGGPTVAGGAPARPTPAPRQVRPERAIPPTTRVPEPQALAPEAPPPEPPEPEALALEAEAPEPAGTRPAVDGATSGTPTLQQVRGAWQSIRTRVENERASASLATQLKRAVVSAVDAKAVTVTLADPMEAERLRDKASYVERAIAEVLGVPLSLRVVVEREARLRSAHRGEPGPRGDGAPPPADSDLALLDYASERIDRRAAISSEQR
jgi:DNA polymerase-3 subunit gamma/tau